MMNIQERLDKKYGRFIGRVYMLFSLFACNALIAVGAAMHYLHSMTPSLMYFGIIGTIACIAILSTPTKVE